jgi:hypothetical protein
MNIFNSSNLKRVLSIHKQECYISYKYNGVRVYYDLYYADNMDRKDFPPKKDCVLFRLHSEKTNQWPIVAINVQKSLVYFLKDYDNDTYQWETKGIKLDFNLANVIDSTYQAYIG